MRLFVALDIPDEIRLRIAEFSRNCQAAAPAARWMKPESLHVTLKFIGEFSPARLPELQDTLRAVRGPALEIRFSGCGFFPDAKSPRVFWVGVRYGPELTRLARTVDEATCMLGVAPEVRPFTPHLTLARTGSGAPQRRPGDRANLAFAALQKRLSQEPVPDFGTMTASEFFLYESRLHPGGAEYRKLEKFELAAPGQAT
jgi:RNA 2',3'-cyclic 3'-phosphodiesterase